MTCLFLYKRFGREKVVMLAVRVDEGCWPMKRKRRGKSEQGIFMAGTALLNYELTGLTSRERANERQTRAETRINN